MKTRKQTSLHHKIINGYECIFIPTTDKTSFITCAINSGYIHETKQNSGISHLLEHLLVSSWKDCKGSCNSYWDSRGAYINASTEKSFMQYYIKGLSTDFKDMVLYITSIITKPVIPESILTREKQAIIDELLEISTNPQNIIEDSFNKKFYAIEGIKYSDDWKLQVDNLKKLHMGDLHKLYKDVFTPKNILFVISSNLSVNSVFQLFKDNLIPITRPIITYPKCFTYIHDIVYIKYASENTTIYIGFPSTIKNPLYIDPLLDMIHSLLFKELRTKQTLLYDIGLYNETTQCGTAIIIKMNVRNNNIKKCIHQLFYFLQKYKIYMPESYKIASIKRELYNYYINNKTMMNYYLSYGCIHTYKLFTKQELIKKIQQIKMSDLTDLCTELFNIDNALCFYQGSQDIKLSWDQIKN